MYVCMYACMYIYIYMYVYHIYIYIYIYIYPSLLVACRRRRRQRARRVDHLLGSCGGRSCGRKGDAALTSETSEGLAQIMQRGGSS